MYAENCFVDICALYVQYMECNVPQVPNQFCTETQIKRKDFQ